MKRYFVYLMAVLVCNSQFVPECLNRSYTIYYVCIDLYGEQVADSMREQAERLAGLHSLSELLPLMQQAAKEVGKV